MTGPPDQISLIITGEGPTKFGHDSKATLIEDRKGLAWRNSEEDVGDLVLVDDLGSMRCRGIQPFKQKNGKGNEDDVHHVPAPSSIFQLKRKPISCPVTPLDGGRSKAGSSERKSISCLSVAHGPLLARDQRQSRAAGFQDGCIRQKGAAQRKRVGRKAG